MTPPAPERAGRREWIAFTVLLLPLMIVSMDVSVLYFAVPFLGAALHPSASQQLWIYDMYGFVLAGLLITMGAVGDWIGRRRLLLFGAAAFGAASLVAAYSHSAGELIAARAVLGVGGATLMPSTLALLRNLFKDDKQRGTAVGIWTGAMTSGVALGPVISGLLLEHFWWGSVFLVNLPAMALLLIAAPLLVPEFRAERPTRPDPVSSLLSLATVLPIVYGIKEFAENGFGAEALLAIVVGAAFGVLFLNRQRRPEPMVDPKLFRRRAFSGAVLANTLAAFMMLGASILSTQYIQEVLGYSPLTGALWSVVPGVLVSGAAFGATTMGRQLGAGKVVAGGFVVSAVGFVVFASIGVHSGLWLLLVAVAVYAAGFLAVMALSTELMLGAVEPDRAAAAASVSETCGELGGALGMALIGSVVAAVYRSHMSSAPAAAKQNLADAVANTKPGGAGTVLAQARTAFVDGMHVVGFAGAAVLVLAAVAAAMFLKKVGAGTSSAPNHSEGATQAAVEEPAAAQVNLAAVSPALPEQRTPGTVGNKDEVDAATILPSTAADREQTGDGAQVAV